MNIKLTLKDRRILQELDKDSTLTSSKLAKIVGVSQQVADYRIKHLLDQKTIYDFYTIIDVGKLGIGTFRVHIRLKNITEKEYTAFAKELFHDYPTFWVGFISGSFDIITDIFAKTNNDFEKLLSVIVTKNRDIIHSYEILPLLEMNLYEYGYFLKQTTPKKVYTTFKINNSTTIDNIDIQILQLIKFNSRLAYEKIAQKIGVTRNTIRDRIKKMEESKIIVGYKIVTDFKHFERADWKIFIKYNNSKIEQEKALLQYLKECEGVMCITKHIGQWNLDVEIQIANAKELQKFIITLRNKFSIIEHYEIIQLLEDYGLDFFPNKLAEELQTKHQINK